MDFWIIYVLCLIKATSHTFVVAFHYIVTYLRSEFTIFSTILEFSFS